MTSKSMLNISNKYVFFQTENCRFHTDNSAHKSPFFRFNAPLARKTSGVNGELIYSLV